MHKVVGYLSALAITLGFLSGCGSSSNQPSPNAVPVVLTIHDAPPAGVTIVSFAVQVTGVTLTGSGSSNASLLNNPVTVQLQNLATGSEILASSSAAPGTYSGITVNFSTPTMTIQNTSGATITVGATSCTTGQFCSVTPTINPMSQTISSAPFPLTLTKGMPVNIALDFNIGSSVQNNLTVVPTITATASTTPLADMNLADISGITGQISQVGTNQFTIRDSNTGMSFPVSTVGTGANATQFEGFTSCTANNSTCLANNQIATVSLGVGDSNPTAFTASSVALQNNFTNSISGTVVGVNQGTGQFQIIPNSSVTPVTGVTNGQVLTVVPAAGATFGVMPGTQPAPAGFGFTGINNVGVGQTIQFNPGTVTGSSIATNNILLSPGSVSGNLSAVSGQNLTVNDLNGLFTGSGTTQLTAFGSPTTQFQGVTNAAALQSGQPVSLGGTLFFNGTTPAFASGQVGQTVAP